MSPLVSFVVPAYNYGRFLTECLASIFAQQTVNDYEVIVLDDGSTDETPDVVRSFTDPRLRSIRHTQNRGHIATVNEGLLAARGDFVARIDADDRYRPDFLSLALPQFASDPTIGLVYGDVALMDERGSLTGARSSGPHAGQRFIGNDLIALLEENFICPASVIARREAWALALPVPDGITGDDWYLTLQMARRFAFCHVDAILADYRVHSSNHHMRVIRDRSDEPSMRMILDNIFAEREPNQRLDCAKQRARKRIYARQYLTLGDKYFGCGMDSHARRCYMTALRYEPTSIARLDVLRHLGATLMGRRLYESLKSRARGRS